MIISIIFNIYVIKINISHTDDDSYLPTSSDPVVAYCLKKK